jgi:prepilin-type N-terminal cleavage/methylation domain-containing protein
LGKVRKSFRHGEKGFTLVELLIVVAILGILAAVAIPNLVSFIGTGTAQATATELDTVQTALVAYMSNNNAALPTADGNPGAITAVIDPYLVGGLASVGYGPYTVAADGDVSGP